MLAAILIVLFALAAAPAQQPAGSSTEAGYQAAAQTAENKFDHIRQNGSSTTPDQTPTVFSAGELNAWINSSNAQLPVGVKKVQFSSDPGVVHATSSVDFDEITAGKTSGNPLLSLFSGTHEVQTEARVSGSGGTGQVHIKSVSIDGVSVPHMALEYFVDRYVRPKHPEVGLDTEFKLPSKIDMAVVGSNQLTITQK
jgi:hypothetical protein